MNDEELIIDLNKSKTLDRIVVNKYGRNEAIYSYLYMYPLSDVEERFIDEIKRKLKENDNANTRIKLADGIIISISDIKVYGEVDLNDASDCQVIKKLLYKEIYECHRIPKGFDYKNNICTSKGNFIQWTETTDYIKAFQYYHSRIGKPKKILIVRLSKNGARRS